MNGQQLEKWSFEFQGTPLKDAVQKIETETGRQFFYAPEWFEANPQITLSIVDKPLAEVLEEVLKNTEVNFYIDNKKIILTKNRCIYDSLPENYFNGTSNLTGRERNPIFIQNDSIGSNKGDSVSFVGKENENVQAKLYSLTGIIRDSKTNEPLPNVFIRLQKTEISTTTGNNGSFKIDVPPGTHTLQVQSDNHKSKIHKVVVYGSGSVAIKLEEDLNQIEEVVIDMKKKEALKSTVTGVTTIDIENMKNIPLVMGERGILNVVKENVLTQSFQSTITNLFY